VLGRDRSALNSGGTLGAGRSRRPIDNELNAAGVHLAFAEMRSRLQDLTLRYGLLETLDREHFYLTLEAALEEIQSGDRAPDRPWRS
jgi:hypothetical protein